MRNSTIPQSSKKGRARRRKLSALIKYLIEHRAFEQCEYCLRGFADGNGLQGAHIVRKDSTGDNDTIWNIFILCSVCHDHTKQSTGLPCPVAEALEIVAKRNRDNEIEEGG